MKDSKIRQVVTAAMFAAICCVLTMTVRVPTFGTNGYVNIGDMSVLLGAWLLGGMYGALAGGIGSALIPTGTAQCVHFAFRWAKYCTPFEHSTVSLFSPKPVCSIVLPFWTNRQHSVSFGMQSIVPLAFQLAAVFHWLVTPAPMSFHP